MKRIFYGISIGVILLCIGVAAYLISSYHYTPDAALDELNEKTDAEVLPLTDDTLALLIEKDGTISYASSNVLRPLGWYKDFTVFKTRLNIHDKDINQKIPYINIKSHEQFSYGLINNDKVAYAIVGNPNIKENAIKTFNLSNYINDPDLRSVKLWYVPISVNQEHVNNNPVFLDKNNNVLEINKEFINKE